MLNDYSLKEIKVINKKIITVLVFLLFVLGISNVKAQVEVVSTGTGSAYALDVPAVFPLRNGVQVTFKANVVCSASPTIDVTGTGAILIKKEGGTTNLTAGDIKAGQVVTLAYDGTFWQMLTGLGNAPAVASPAWSLTGNALTVDGTNYIGTTDDIAFNIRVNSQKAGRISNSTGSVTFFGYQAGITTTGIENSAFGHQALFSNTSGYQNSAVGFKSLNSNTTGYTNTAFGSSALFSNTTAFQNVAVGYDALFNNRASSQNVAIGSRALYSQSFTTAFSSENVAIGTNALYSNNPTSTTNGYRNTAVGHNALFSNTTGSDNTATGNSSLLSNSTGIRNSAYGYSSLNLNTTGGENTAIGRQALNANTTGSRNTATGSVSLVSNTIGSNNTAFGYGALFSNNAGSQGTAIGYNAMLNANNTTTAFTNQNVAVGSEALRGSGTPASNTGNGNTAIGYQTLIGNTSGNYNTTLGYQTLYSNTTGLGNIAIGYIAGLTGIPANANTTGTYNVFIGYNSGPGTSTQLTNAIAIGRNSSVTSSNAMVLGGTGADAVNVGINTTAPTERLDVIGNIKFSGALMPNNVAGTPGQVLTSQGPGIAPTWVTSGGSISGSGSTNYLARWTPTGTQLGIGATYDDGTNVGIGTNSPSSKLHVFGTDITIQNTGGNFKTGYTVKTALNEWFIGQEGTATSGFRITDIDAATPRFQIDQSGNVGIGTTTPLFKLHVADDFANALGIQVSSDTDHSELVSMRSRGTIAAPTSVMAYDYIGGVTFGGYNGTSFEGTSSINAIAAENYTGSAWGTELEFTTTPIGATNHLQRMVIKENGNIGIGTTTPFAKLHVAGDNPSSIVNQIAENTSSGIQSGIVSSRSRGTTTLPSAVLNGDQLGGFYIMGYDGSSFGSNGPAAGMFAIAAENFSPTNNGSDLYLLTTPIGSNTSVERIVIKENGFIGIGTNNPNQKLEIQNGHILLSNTGSQSELRFKEANANGGNIISFKAPAALSGNVNYTLPDNAGSFDDVLTTDGTGVLIWKPASGGGLSGGTVNYLPKWNSGTSLSSTSLVYDSGTGVGIGTTNANSLGTSTMALTISASDVYSGSKPVGLEMRGSQGSANAMLGQINFIHGSGNTETSRIESRSGSGNVTHGQFAFYTNYNDGFLERMRITDAGNVGIGTSTPGITGGSGKFLTISSGVGSPLSVDHADLELNGGSSDPWGIQNKIDMIARSTDGSNYVTGQIVMTNTQFSTQQGQMHFYTKGAFLADRMMIDENGNVGIGTNTPLSLLSVGSGFFSPFQVDASGNIVMLNNVNTSFPFAQGAPNTYLQNDGSGNLSWATIGAGANDWTRSGSSLHPTILSDFVGIGTSTPSSFLNVQPSTPGATDLIRAITTGDGKAGRFEINNTSNTDVALSATSNGSGTTINGFNTGTGRAGEFQITNSGNTAAALTGNTNGSGPAVYGFQSGTGAAVRAQVSNGSSFGAALMATTIGLGNAGFFQVNNTSSAENTVEIENNGNSSKGLSIIHTGASAASTDYGAYVTNTGSGAANIGGYFRSSGATNNYALQLGGSTTGTLSISPAATTTSYALIMPSTQGNGYLQNDGSGNLSWVPPGGVTAWNLTGNSGTTPVSNYVGTTDNDFIMKAGTGANIRLNLGANTSIHTASFHTFNTSASTTPGLIVTGPNYNSAMLGIQRNAAITTAGTPIGSLTFSASGSTINQAEILAYREAASSGAGDIPTALTFWTTPDASSTSAERMRISNGGNVGIGLTNPLYKLHTKSTTAIASGTDIINSTDEITGTGGARVIGSYSWARGSGASGKAIGVAGFADYVNTPTDAIGVLAGFNSTMGTLPAAYGFSSALVADGNNSTFSGVFLNGAVSIGDGIATANVKFSVRDGHIQSKQSTLPTVGFTGSLISAAITTGGTDTKGGITTTGTLLTGTTASVTVTFNMPYSVTSPTVVVCPANAATRDLNYFVTSTTTTFTINFLNNTGASISAPSFNYIVIQ